MKTPPQYPDELSSVLDAHLRCSCLPSWYCVNYMSIADDFDVFFKKNKLKKLKVLDLYGLSIPYAALDSIVNVKSVENRIKFKKTCMKLHKNIVTHIDFDDINILDFNLILINLEFGGYRGHEMPADFNELFDRNIFVFGYEFRKPDDRDKLYYINDDGFYVDRISQLKWKKRITSHMHLGYKWEDFKTVRFYNLTVNY